MRESYRLNNFLLAGEDKMHYKSFEIVFMYTGCSVGLAGGTSFVDVNRSMRRILKAISREEP